MSSESGSWTAKTLGLLLVKNMSAAAAAEELDDEAAVAAAAAVSDELPPDKYRSLSCESNLNT